MRWRRGVEEISRNRKNGELNDGSDGRALELRSHLQTPFSCLSSDAGNDFVLLPIP